MASFGQLLRHSRVSAGLTQEELARAARLSTRAVSDLERGISKTARNDTARLLADALHLAGTDRVSFVTAARGRPPAGGVAAATRTLPRDTPSFTGRDAELRELAEAAQAGGICTIGGMPGTGKTALAVHAAHQLASRFPDGQIYLPLHAHTAGQQPATPAEALASLLQATGAAPRQIPADLEARAGAWRDRVTGKRLLLLLDDAASSDQVRPLLPGTSGSLVLITSRHHLTALEDARPLSLGTLPPARAAQLLTRLAARPGLEPADPAVTQITRLCGCLPLAVGMLARQLSHHPAWTPADLARDLAAAVDRLEFLHAENVSVAAAFERSYQDLPGPARVMFCRLGLHPGSDLEPFAAAALAGTSLGAARRDLETLYDHYLLTETARGRYRFHDLIRQYARDLAAALPPAQRRAATGRLLDYYLRATRTAAGHLRHRPSPAPGGPPPAGTGDPGGPGLAADWLAAERLNLDAAARYAAATGRARHATAIPAALHPFLRSHGHWDQAIALHQAAAAAARDAGTRLAEARAVSDLADIQFLADQYPKAADSLSRALQLYRSAGDRLGEAAALTTLGAIQHATGSPAAATTLTRALQLYRSAGDQPGEAAALTTLGAIQHATGSPAAATTLTRALQLYRSAGDQPGEAAALTSLGAAQCLAGDYPAAATTQGRALELYQRLADRLGQATALTHLGAVQHLTGQHSAATVTLTRALELYRDLGDRSGEAEALSNLADLALSSDGPAAARPYYEQALQIATSIAVPAEQARALEGIGRCLLQDNHREQGTGMLRQALALYRQIGSPRARQVRNALRGHDRQQAR